jgi:hypothetical protein
MSAEELIDELYDMTEKAWNFPMSRGRGVMDCQEVKQILDELRESLPQEIRQAKAIVADRTKILEDAKREAETVVRVAQDHAKAMVAQDEVAREAQQKANELLSQSQTKVREMRRASNDYIDDLMKRTDDDLSQLLAELRKTRQNIKASQRSGLT